MTQVLSMRAQSQQALTVLWHVHRNATYPERYVSQWNHSRVSAWYKPTIGRKVPRVLQIQWIVERERCNTASNLPCHVRDRVVLYSLCLHLQAPAPTA